PRLEMDVAVIVMVEPGKNPQQRAFARTVEAEHADLRTVEERQTDVAEDLLSFDRLGNGDHGEYDFGLFRLRHACAQPYPSPRAAQAVSRLSRASRTDPLVERASGSRPACPL